MNTQKYQSVSVTGHNEEILKVVRTSFLAWGKDNSCVTREKNVRKKCEIKRRKFTTKMVAQEFFSTFVRSSPKSVYLMC